MKRHICHAQPRYIQSLSPAQQWYAESRCERHDFTVVEYWPTPRGPVQGKEYESIELGPDGKDQVVAHVTGRTLPEIYQERTITEKMKYHAGSMADLAIIRRVIAARPDLEAKIRDGSLTREEWNQACREELTRQSE